MSLRDIVRPGQPIDQVTREKLKELWVKTYLALMMITSRGKNKRLDYMKEKLAETNEVVMTFLSES